MRNATPLTNNFLERPMTTPNPSTTPTNLASSNIPGNPTAPLTVLSLTKPQNISPDLRYEHLKQFLDNVTSIINQHAAVINDMQGEIIKKATDKKLIDALNLLTETVNIYDNDFIKILNGQMGKAKNEKTGNEIDDSINKLCNKINILGHSSTFLFKKVNGVEEKTKELEAKIMEKMNTNDYKRKSKKFKNKILSDFDELKKSEDKRIFEMDKKFGTQIASFEEMVREVEKKTVWRIQDCEELLRKRINDEYVDFTVRNSEEKLMKLINNITGGGMEQYERMKTDLERRIKLLDDTLNEKIKINKKQMKDIEDGLLNQMMTNDKFNEEKLKQEAKINDLLFKLKDFEAKYNPAPLLERQNNFINNLDNKVSNLERDLLKKISETMASLSNLNSDKNKDGQVDPFQYLDPHKLCSLESDLSVLRTEVHEHRHLLKTLEEDLRAKLKFFDNNMLENLAASMKPGQVLSGGGVERDEVIRLIEQFTPPVNIADDENFKKLKKDLMDMLKKTEAFVDLEKRVSRTLKDLDINNLIKQVKSKANQDDVTKDNLVFEHKLGQLQEQLGFLKKEIDHLSVNIKRNITNNIQFNTNLDSFNTILSTKKIVPIQCLSCGVQSMPPNYSKGKVLGTDGKYYKGDPNADYNNDQGMNFKVSGGGYHTYQKQNNMSNSNINFRPNTMQGQANTNVIPLNGSNNVPTPGFEAPKVKNGRQLRPGSAKK